MRRLSRLWKQLRLRMLEMQIAMINDYAASLKDQQAVNQDWLNECREKEFHLAAELEGLQVAKATGKVYMVEVGGTAFFIPHDADLLRQLMATHRSSQAA